MTEADKPTPLLSVSDLHVRYRSGEDSLHVVNGVSFGLDSGQTLGIVGESGCGKSTIAFAIMRLLKAGGSVPHGDIRLAGASLLAMPESRMAGLRGKEIALVSQDPLTSLNPVMTIGAHLTEVLARHTPLRGQAARDRAIELLKAVGIPDPKARFSVYPYQISGGMRQRVAIALALSCDPKIIIADEPTTALDVTIQAQVLELLKDVRDRLGTAIVLVSHDLGVVAGLADRVMVVYGGCVVESGPAEDVLLSPRHPYTIALIASRPDMDMSRERRLAAIPGVGPRLTSPPTACVFAPRCAHRMPACEVRPTLGPQGEAHQVACWLHAPAGSA